MDMEYCQIRNSRDDTVYTISWCKLILRDFDQYDDIKKIVSNIEYDLEKSNHYLWNWITHEIVYPYSSTVIEKIWWIYHCVQYDTMEDETKVFMFTDVDNH